MHIFKILKILLTFVDLHVPLKFVSETWKEQTKKKKIGTNFIGCLVCFPVNDINVYLLKVY